jgi:hypothetical protein
MKLKRFVVVSFTLAISLIWMPSISKAGLNSPVNLENPRVVPIFGQFSAAQVSPGAGWSGFLYSPRIVFSAAHSHFKFDQDGNRIPDAPPFITVGLPNSSAKSAQGRVKVIKTYVPSDFKRSPVGSMNDFSVLVLEKDLIQVNPAKLLNAEIELELVNSRAEVAFHGYGEYRDRCAAGQKNPCPALSSDHSRNTSELPRINKINLAPKSDFPSLQGANLAAVEKEVLVSNHQGCSGDSGGPITTIYKGEAIYLGQGLNGFKVYACGAGNGLNDVKDPEAFGLFSPVYKHLDLIREAEEFVKAQNSGINSKSKKEISINCIKGKTTRSFSGVNPKCPKGYRKK